MFFQSSYSQTTASTSSDTSPESLPLSSPTPTTVPGLFGSYIALLYTSHVPLSSVPYTNATEVPAAYGMKPRDAGLQPSSFMPVLPRPRFAPHLSSLYHDPYGKSLIQVQLQNTDLVWSGKPPFPVYLFCFPNNIRSPEVHFLVP